MIHDILKILDTTDLQELDKQRIATDLLRLFSVKEQNEQLCFCGERLEAKVGDNRAWLECNNGHEQ